VDFDARIKLSQAGLAKTHLQFNVRNAFDKRYLGDISANLTGTAVGQPGYRRTFVATIRAEF
jgi:iron complex outermembrane receptor protein